MNYTCQQVPSASIEGLEFGKILEQDPRSCILRMLGTVSRDSLLDTLFWHNICHLVYHDPFAGE